MYKNLSIKNSYLLTEAVDFHKKGFIDKAKEIYGKILKQDPANTEVLKLSAIIEIQLNNYSQALYYINKSIKTNNTIAELYSIKGISLKNLKRYDEALSNFQKAIEIDRNFVDAYFNMSSVYQIKNELKKSLDNLYEVIKIDVNNYKAFSNIAFIKIKQSQYHEALKNLEKAININPNYLNAYLLRGNVYKELKNIEKSLSDYDKVISVDDINLNSLYYDAKFNKSQLLLSIQKFSEGWELYESRFNLKNYYKQKIDSSKSKLNSLENLSDKTILVYGEQGIGDNIHFSRYLPLLRKKCKKIIFKVDNIMKGFFKSLNVADKVCEFNEKNDKYDFYIYLMSLPFLFNTNISNIPKNCINISSEKDIEKKWSAVLEKYKNHYKIGIKWDVGNGIILDRSFSVNFFKKISGYKNCKLFSLEKNSDNKLKQKDLNILFFEDFDKLGLFSDSIALIEKLDLIITCDTSIAHLAGTMKKNVWLILNDVSYWLWMQDIDYSPWYESIKIFRCKNRNDWGPVFKKIEQDLLNFMK